MAGRCGSGTVEGRCAIATHGIPDLGEKISFLMSHTVDPDGQAWTDDTLAAAVRDAGRRRGMVIRCSSDAVRKIRRGIITSPGFPVLDAVAEVCGNIDRRYFTDGEVTGRVQDGILSGEHPDAEAQALLDRLVAMSPEELQRLLDKVRDRR